MKRIIICMMAVMILARFSAHSQYVTTGWGSYAEVDRASKTVQQMHLNDEFYVQIRCMYDVRESIDDYILLKENGKWRAEHKKVFWDPPASEGYTNTPRKDVVTVLKMDESKIETFLKAIDIDRLVQGSKIDSLSLDDLGEHVLGYNNFAIMICSKGKYRLIEYPASAPRYDKPRDQLPKSVSWRSAYLDNLIARFTQALPMENDRLFEVYNGILSQKRR